GDNVDIISAHHSIPAVISKHSLGEWRVVGKRYGQKILTIAQFVLDILSQLCPESCVFGADRPVTRTPLGIHFGRWPQTVVLRQHSSGPEPPLIFWDVGEQPLFAVGYFLHIVFDRDIPLSTSLNDYELIDVRSDSWANLICGCSSAYESNSLVLVIDCVIPLGGMEVLALKFCKAGEIRNLWGAE